MSYPYSLDYLEHWETTYWNWNEGDNPTLAWAYYLGPIGDFNDAPPQPLLHVQMECVEKRGYLPQLGEGGSKVTLAILVGESFEPLLQSIWAYQPTRVVPVVNKFYGDRENDRGNRRIGTSQWRKLRKLIGKLPEERRRFKSLPTINKKQLVEDNPSSVFQHLQNELRDDLADPECRVVIDITGAKKTMVAGAFLLAAYTNAEIAYVDFDSYHPKKRRPYGYSCRMTTVRNPFDEWGLRDWVRVSQLYSQYDFEGALAVLPADLPDGAKSWQKSVSDLKVFLTLCSHWENGQLREAKQAKIKDNLQQYVPLAVNELGDYWPFPTSNREGWLSERFLCDPEALRVYALDELARAKRLLSISSETRRDYRAAFTRAYALHETLIKARVVGSFYKGEFCVKRKDTGTILASNKIPSELQNRARMWLLYWLQAHHSKKLLENSSEDKPSGATWYKPKGEKSEEVEKVSVKIWRKDSATYPQPLLSLTGDFDLEEIQNKRNVVIHTYVPVSQSDAEDAIALAKANLEDYCDRWGEWIDSSFDRAKKFEPLAFALPSWKELKEACELNFIPEPNVE